MHNQLEIIISLSADNWCGGLPERSNLLHKWMRKKKKDAYCELDLCSFVAVR